MSASWSMERWGALDESVRRAPDSSAMPCIYRSARTVLRSFSSSFFLVTRFLPPQKRAMVEIISASVRYPDELVDTFPLPAEEKCRVLEEWQASYERALELPDVGSRLRSGVPWILAGFAEVVRECGIPAAHYRAFLTAMRENLGPLAFSNGDELIERYVYGRAVVVGYFLAHACGTARWATLRDVYDCSANLGVALQFTNFCRDVTEDGDRGRLYIPLDLVARRGLDEAVVTMAENAERRYRQAADAVFVFAEDTQPAIRACIEVYRRLNRRILLARGDTSIRHSVPAAEKFGALPAGKYWRLPLAYLGAL